MLHITNGESVVSTFRQARFPGAYLSWVDVLHDGPVPRTETLSELSDIRAQALAGFGWGSYEKIRAEFAARDQMLEDFRRHEEVVLWFEHDLFDQLQLLQLLDWFGRQELGKTRLLLVQVNSYPGVKPFYGLGQLSGPQLVRLFPTRAPVTSAHTVAAREAWQAFGAGDPAGLLQTARQQSPALPFLAAALQRFLEEYPWTSDGLSRSERQILQAAAAGQRTRESIYGESRKLEETPWGDASVYLRISGLASGKTPALAEVQKGEYAITEAGHALLEGNADWIALRGGIDTWLGGVHLAGEQPQWRWDQGQGSLVGIG
jgi:DNA-binding transcriptional LysR family regulator